MIIAIIFYSCLLASSVNLHLIPNKEDFEVIYPEQIHKSKSKRDLSTLGEGQHEYYVTFKINSKVSDYVLDLERTGNQLGSVLLRTFDGNGNPVHIQHEPEKCYYHGSIKGNNESSVFLSTCHGLSGTIDDGKNRYDIQPHGDNGAHKFHCVDQELDDIILKLKSHSFPGESFQEQEHFHEEHIRKRRNIENLRHYELINVEPQYIPYLTVSQTRYVEMFALADHGLYRHYNNDTDLVLERVLNALLQVDKAYQAINVRLVLVALEVQTNGPTFTRHRTGGADLSSFRNYVNDVIKKTSAYKDVRIDNSFLLSSYYWSDCAGMAYVGTLCGSSSAAVNAWSFKSISGPTVIIGHEFGHNMNFPHDSDGCKCLTARGCFMGGSKSSLPGFSDCNMNRLASKTFSCINDYPVAPILRRCGDGIKSPDEECDCGSPENCLKNNDTCCEPHRCHLKSFAQCSYLNSPECCSDQCLFKKQGSLCREANGNCDVPEYCPGDSENCPTDLIMANGSPCGDSLKMMVGTLHRQSTTTTSLSPNIIARYVKILPQLWNKNGYACMKLEMLGCDADQVAVNKPTPISTVGLYYHRPMCITPDIESCSGSIPDGTKIKYRSMPNNDCYHDHMLFVFGADGSLTHHCSNKKVCQSADGEYLILSSACSAEDSKYTRTQESSLQQISSGNCLVAKDGWPESGDFIKLTSWCVDDRYNRLKLVFFEQDCIRPMGFQNGNLPDSAFSAGSVYWEEKYSVPNIRLNKNGWCAKTKTDGSWFQIDFGKRVTISTVQMKGIYWDWITGYHLMYSDDSVVWHGYKESNAGKWTDMDSHCFNGDCALTPRHQCQKLWNTNADEAAADCWINLNSAVLNGYGTCSATANVSCHLSNVRCGQLQCVTTETKPYYVDYGTQYKSFTYNENTCSGAQITTSEQAGLGMVDDGTICGDGKMCVAQQCKTPQEHGFHTCPVLNGKVCNGKGTCKSDGVCLCTSSYNPADGCATLFQPIHGGWSDWSSWSVCTAGCSGGTQNRHRFCNQPYPKHGGDDCPGPRQEERSCNTDPCPVGRSCKAIKFILESNEKPVYDGVYTIEPKQGLRLKVYCDMKRNGGGWTLIVASDTNSWTKNNVRMRNENDPQLYKDYSILQYADDIKRSYLIAGDTFQYRLEANVLGKWGGIFEAPKMYDLNSENPNQQDVKLVEQFDDWEFNSDGIEQRIPYVYEHRLTTSGSPTRNTWGSITDNVAGLHPSKWIRGDLKMGYPEHVWYFIREGDYSYPKSCLELMFRSFKEKIAYPSGIYKIAPRPGQIVQTYCDFDRHGGGWTLLTKASSRSGWTKEKIEEYNSDDVSQHDYSIFGFVDDLSNIDVGEASFEYMVEADGIDTNGGIFSYPVGISLLTCPPRDKKPIVLKKFGSWDVNTENFAKYPIFATSKNGIFLTSSSDNTEDVSGTIISNTRSAKYMESHASPSIIKVWHRAGGSRKSCNDLKIHGYHKGKMDYKDGFYMMSNFQPMYCDMETDPNEGWTLLVTAVSNGWSMDGVFSRNPYHPSLHKDYSILKQADGIKSLSKNTSFKYMIDANHRRGWGGIWEADISYSFVSTSNSKDKVSLLTKYDNWDYEVDWWRGPRARMPYIGRESNHKALLTTASYDDYTEWGTILSNNSDGYLPSKWIYPQMRSPGVIWYWVNENDCDEDYQKIDGKFSPWSLWSTCSKYCGVGMQSRIRTCNLPVVRCGGDPCDSSVVTRETRSCHGNCHQTRITDPDNDYCFEPQNGGCNPNDGTFIVLRPTSSKCNANESLFTFDSITGRVNHPCSGKRVCTENGGLGYGAKLIVSSSCTDAARTVRTMWNSVQYGTLCWDPSGGRLGDNVQIVLWNRCTLDHKRFIFPNLATGPVHGAYFNNIDGAMLNFTSDPRFPDSPTISGVLDNFESQRNFGNQYGLRIWSYLVAPQTGEYIFVSACDNTCKVFLSTDTDPANKKEIIEQKGYASYEEWDKREDQRSARIMLEVGAKYFIEALFLESRGADHISVGMYLPDGAPVLPITSDYLTENEH